LEYDSHPDETGEALVHPADGSLEKTASDVHPDVQQYLAEAPTPPNDMMRLLITALSSHDTFGPNKNGDGFYREDLLNNIDYGEHPDGDGNLNIPMYRSFQHFARPYKHHRNNESSPAYGKVEQSFYNPQMDRVELLTLLDTAKAPDIARRIRKYQPVKTSMGFRAAYDTCSVCGNKAKSRRDYCDHLKNNMLSVRPDGHIVHARNPKGKFFDISFVGTPADGTSRAVHVGRLPVGDGVDLNKKNKGTGDSSKNPGPTSGKGEGVQSLDDGAKPERSAEKKKEARQTFAKAACAGWAGDQEVTLSADIASEVGLDGSEPLTWRKEAKEADGKESAIDKRVDGEMEEVQSLPPEKEKRIEELVQKIRGSAPMIQKKVLDRLSGYPMETVASTMAVSGISLRPEEMQHLALTKAGAPQLSQKLWSEGLYLAPEEKTASGGGLQLGPDKVDTRLLQKVAGNKELMEGRSFRHGPLIERIGSLDKEAASAMGPNPYLRHRERITPRKAREMATQEEQQTMQERRRMLSRKPKKTERASMLEAIAHLLTESEWNNGQVSKKQQEALRSNYRRPRRTPRRRRARINGRPRQPSMMTMPMANYIRGTGSSPSVYGSSGVAEQAMSKESSLRKEASEYVRAVVKAMGRMDKVASDQIEFVTESPENYEAADVEAALLCRLDRASS
jgi:hypothetical protein